MLTLAEPQTLLQTTVDKLKRALEAQIAGRELAWTEQMARIFQAVEDALRMHMAEMEGRDGLFRALARPKNDALPAITRQIGRLRREHHDLLIHVQELENVADGVRNALLPPAQQRTWDVRSPVISPRGLRARGRRLLEALDQHQQAEAKLLQEKYVQDTGVGD